MSIYGVKKMVTTIQISSNTILRLMGSNPIKRAISDYLETGEAELSINDKFIYFQDSSEGGVDYSIYESESDYHNELDPIDGGLCTGSIDDAVVMALEV